MTEIQTKIFLTSQVTKDNSLVEFKVNSLWENTSFKKISKNLETFKLKQKIFLTLIVCDKEAVQSSSETFTNYNRVLQKYLTFLKATNPDLRWHRFRLITKSQGITIVHWIGPEV